MRNDGIDPTAAPWSPLWSIIQVGEPAADRWIEFGRRRQMGYLSRSWELLHEFRIRKAPTLTELAFYAGALAALEFVARTEPDGDFSTPIGRLGTEIEDFLHAAGRPELMEIIPRILSSVECDTVRPSPAGVGSDET